MIEKLIEAGLNNYEARVYDTLLNEGLINATKISELAEIPQGRVYSVLKSLEQKGFCTIYSGSIKKYQAINPKRAFKELIKAKKKDLKEMEQLSKELEASFERKQTETAPLDFVQILTSKQSQINKFDDLIKASENTLYSFNKGPYATGFMRQIEEIKAASAPLIKIIENGTKVKALFEAETEHIDAFINMIEYYESIGEEVRICAKLPIKMLLSDNKMAMVSLRSLSASRFKMTSMVVEHSDLTNALIELFESYWDKGMTIEEFKENQT